MTAVDTSKSAPPLSGAKHSRSKAVLHSVAHSRSPISLDDVMEVAELQTRNEYKYLLTAEQFVELSGKLEALRVLQIDAKRLFAYESVYFDSPELDLFRAHRQGRRKRYKVRTRTYLDSRESLFEVKLTGGRGESVKHRLPYRIEDRFHLSDTAGDFLAGTLREQYKNVRPPELDVSLTTHYGRTTFVDHRDNARLTCDIDLACTRVGQTEYGPDRILVESKSVSSGRADVVLADMGLRPISLSKYCMGIALTNPHMAANPWNQVLRAQFGWQRRDATAA